MAKTTTMRLVELMVLKQDIQNVLLYLGKEGDFQFQNDVRGEAEPNEDRALFEKLSHVRSFLGIADLDGYHAPLELPTQEDRDACNHLIELAEQIHQKELSLSDNLKRVSDASTEAQSFANLKVSYSELESLSFLTMRIGKIAPASYDSLVKAVGNRAVILKLGEDGSRIMAACSKNARFALDTELKAHHFVELAVPADFKGIPDDMLATLAAQKEEAQKAFDEVQEERRNFALAHEEQLKKLLQAFSLMSQVHAVQDGLESTQFVYRLTGWIPAYASRDMMKRIDAITEGRAALREYAPDEVAAVVSGQEKVPTKLKHGKIVSNFERMVFSYGSPLYGTIDPTPFVALFFTLLFGLMFGDAGQGFVFLLIGILMHRKLFKLDGWEKFGIVFMAIGISSMIMGILTGEVFANAELLAPFSRWVTGLFGTPRDQILPMMPSGDSQSIMRMFMFFGFAVGVGFIINTTGLVINIINQFALKHYGKALFSKTGLTGACFFWYVVVFALRLAFLGHSPALYDWIIIGTLLLLTAFGEPLTRLVDGERPVLEDGLGTAIISAVVEVIEIVSSYLSNTVSFLRVGAFALAHAVLGYIIETLCVMAPAWGGILISIVGNAIVVVLEGMVVSIQVVRLQYYEFFSKFFNETGREFKPFVFEYHSVA